MPYHKLLGPPPVGLFFDSVPTDQQKFPSPARYFPLFGIKLLPVHLTQGDPSTDLLTQRCPTYWVTTSSRRNFLSFEPLSTLYFLLSVPSGTFWSTPTVVELTPLVLQEFALPRSVVKVPSTRIAGSFLRTRKGLRQTKIRRKSKND